MVGDESGGAGTGTGAGGAVAADADAGIPRGGMPDVGAADRSDAERDGGDGPAAERDGAERNGGDGPAAEPDGAERIAGDPLAEDPRVETYLGAGYPAVAAFHTMLTDEGVLRGLIGPREVDRLWERHLLNSAALVPYLPTTGKLVDVGSGAGLPGVVLAAMLPDVEVVLVEPMERRVDWLTEVVARLGLTNVVVRRGRAEEFHGAIEADAVTARAVAPLDRLARWTLPLLAPGGVLVALKGRQATAEVEAARHVIRKLGGRPAEVLEAGTIDGLGTTTVVRVVHAGTRRR
jgi:16S rRNA (guanine527-N7)-methyltransferase